MLTLTPAAAEVVRLIIADAPVEPTGGLRIASGGPTEDGTELEMTLVDAPEATDEAIEQGEARIFLESEAAEMLDGKVLDADLEDGEVRFAVIDPAAPHEPSRNGSGPG